MTRERKADLGALNEYLASYSIREIVANRAYQAELKGIHKVYFSVLNWNAEMLCGENSMIASKKDDVELLNARLAESFSDIGSAVFNWSHGGYKTARIMIRSAIENFIRCVAGVESYDLLGEKNIFTLFEEASKLAIYNSSSNVKDLFKKIHSDYKLLCQDVHTADAGNMENISFVAEFPRFDAEKSRQTSLIICRVIKNIISMLCLIFSVFFHKMHHRNKENILISIPASLKPSVLGIAE